MATSAFVLFQPVKGVRLQLVYRYNLQNLDLTLFFCHRAKRLPNEISLGGCKSYNMRLALLTSQTR